MYENLSIRSRTIRMGLMGYLFIIIFVLCTIRIGHDSKLSLCSPSNFIPISISFFNISNNTEDKQTLLNNNAIWCLHMAHRLDSEEHFPRSPVLRAPSINSTKLNRLPYHYSLWKSSPRQPRVITPCEHSLMMRLLMFIERICRKNNIEFMISDGTLLGSWRHHDIIPWDDDLDLRIAQKDRRRFMHAVNDTNTTLIQTYALGGSVKICFAHTVSAGKHMYQFPFADIYFYEKNDTHLWITMDNNLIQKVEDVFPLMMRPLGELWLPSPRKPDRMFSFDPYKECRGHAWSHRGERYKGTIVLKCNELKHIYPFVERNNQSKSIEILKINHTIIHTVIYN